MDRQWLGYSTMAKNERERERERESNEINSGSKGKFF